MKSSLLYQLVEYSLWLAIIVGLLTIKSLRYYKVAFYFWFLLVVCIVDFVVSRYLQDGTGLATRVWYTILRPIEYAVYLKLFLTSPEKWVKYFKIVSLLAVSCFSIYTLLFRLDVLSAASTVMIVYKVALLFVLFIFFRKLMENDAVLSLSQVPLFWLAVGVFFFSAGNIVATGFYHQIRIISPSVAKALYQLNFILGTFQYLMTVYCFYLYHKKRKAETWMIS